MAIQLRRGDYDDFDPTKLMPGEFAVVTEDDPDGTDGCAIYMCFGTGIVKRFISAEDLSDILDALTLTWNDITDKPTIFPTNWSNVDGKPTVFPTNWSNVDNKPTVFPTNWANVADKPSINAGSVSYATIENHARTASGYAAHAENQETVASGFAAHAEGQYTTASGGDSHAQGQGTSAIGDMSSASGFWTKATHRSQNVFGELNIPDPSTTAASTRGTYVEIVGNGTSADAKSNARTLDWSGNEVLAGKLTVGAAPTNNMDVATKQYVDTAVSGAAVTYSDPNSDGNIVISIS